MRVTIKKIMKLNPCKDRLDNFNKHYPNFSGSLEKFFSLDEITHHDKLWVALRLASHDTRVVFTMDCAFAAEGRAAYAAACAAYATACAAYAAADPAADPTTYSAAAYYADVTYVAACAATYSDDAAERQNELDALCYLINQEEK